MPVVVPVAAGGVLAEIALDMLLLVGIIAVSGLALWVLTHARNAVGIIPIVGGIAVNLVDGMIILVRALASSANGMMSGATYWLGHNTGVFLAWVTWPV